jgi:serine/threonine-protein kinase PknK
VSEIGSGAFATVYRATEVDTGRQVALKVLRMDTVHPHLVETFNREIQTLAKVSDHPNIVTLYRPVTTPDGRPVLVLELCQESLAARIRRSGPLGARDVTRIGIKIAGALETAHRNGFLHRDMKPQNVLVTQFGEPALGDFGVAALQASAQATAGVFGFTTLHAAPEVLEGHQLSEATDVYGLASTMYQALTGLAPFATFENEAPASVILRIIRDPVRPIRNQDIPIGLSDLLEAALAKEPGGRPATAVEFADALVAVESAAGWPATTYVVWGERTTPEVPTPSGHSVASDLAASGAQAMAPLALDRPMYASAPSVQVADVAHQRPEAVAPETGRQPGALAPAVVEPVLPPAAPVLPIAEPPPRAATPPAVVEPSPAPVASPPAAPSWATPPPPPPPPARTGPAVASPGQPLRNIVNPDQVGRGHQGPATPVAPDQPLAPLNPAPDPAAPPSPRPEFVDPPPPDAGRDEGPAQLLQAARGSRQEGVYEQTILPTGRVPAGLQASTGDTVRTSWRPPLIWVAAVGAAVVIVVIALLLIAGVL